MTSNRNAATRRARAAKALALLCALITIASTLSIFAIPVGAEETEVTSDIVSNTPVLECTESYCHTYTEIGWHSVSEDALARYQYLGEISAYGESGLTFWLLLDDTCIADANICFYFDQNGVKSDAVKINLSKTHTFNDGRSLYYVSLSVSRLEKISYGYPLYFDFRHNVTQNTASSYYVQAGVSLTTDFNASVGIEYRVGQCFETLLNLYEGSWGGGITPDDKNVRVSSSTVTVDKHYTYPATDDGGITIWMLTADYGLYAPYIYFSRSNTENPYGKVYLERICSIDGRILYFANVSHEEWGKLVDGAYTPQYLNFYCGLTEDAYELGYNGWPQNIDFGFALTSNFLAACGDEVIEGIRQDTEKTAYTQGYYDGSRYASESAREEGYASGLVQGEKIGIDKGYKKCLDENGGEGQVQGGYAKGFIEGAFSIFKQAWETISSLDLGIGLTIGGIVGTAILAVVVIFIVKMVKK